MWEIFLDVGVAFSRVLPFRMGEGAAASASSPGTGSGDGTASELNSCVEGVPVLSLYCCRFGAVAAGGPLEITGPCHPAESVLPFGK